MVKLRNLKIPNSAVQELAQLADTLIKQPNPVVFTSVAHGAGTSTIAIAAARTLAEMYGKRTLLVDCNLLSNCHAAFVDHTPKSPYQVLDSDIEDLHVLLPHGQELSPHKLIESDEFKTNFAEFSDSFDCIIIDVPPVTSGAEVLALSKRGYPLVLIADAIQTRIETMIDIKQRIERYDGKILGVILNRRKLHIPRSVYNYL